RFLPNPYYVKELRPFDGTDERVREFLCSQDKTAKMLTRLEDMFSFLLPCYHEEGKSKLVIAVGCTGGRHRSVFVAEEISRYLAKEGFSVDCSHRDVEKV
ncbi:MAG: RNase adaptor protein RapZ, partial [Oscillospiraceae bacterium]|nr:RNase adaptor protein RapZ [Oscillospiraceae bacterium]